MKLIKQPNSWSCLLTAFAMATESTPEDLIAMIGHDGSEIIWPDLPEGYQHRAFHPEELFECALDLGFKVFTVEARPCCISEKQDNTRLFLKLGQKLENMSLDDMETASDMLEEAKRLYHEIHSNYRNVYHLQMINNQDPKIRLNDYMDKNNGVILGLTFADHPHAVAWNCKEQMIYDPNGSKYRKTRFIIERFIVVEK